MAEIGVIDERVLALARRRRLTVAVAESLTGGQLAAAITAVPGASAVFRGSVTAYATDLKASVLGVDAALLGAHGAVHHEVARQMAEGVRRVCRADLGIATTGVAGPEPQDGHPVGTVFVAVAGPALGPEVPDAGLVPRTGAGREWVEAERCAFGAAAGQGTQTRARVQRLSVAAALRLTLRYLDMRTVS
ncbi:MAG: CinA family protein [Actinocrinis sp.]